MTIHRLKVVTFDEQPVAKKASSNFSEVISLLSINIFESRSFKDEVIFIPIAWLIC